VIRAVVAATAAAASGEPAALLRVGATTLLGRLRDQLARYGVDACTVLTRPEWRERCELALSDVVDVTILGVGTLSASLDAVAQLARGHDEPLLVLQGEILMHDAVLDGLLHDPRVQTGIVSSGAHRGQPGVYLVRSDRGRMISAESPYHAITGPTTAALGMLKIGATDRPVLARAASELAGLCREALPPQWERELSKKVTTWGRTFFAEHAREAALVEQLKRESGSEKWFPDPTVLQTELDARFRTAVLDRVMNAQEDVVPVLLTALVRSDVVVNTTYLRDLFWARPFTQSDVDDAVRGMNAIAEDHVLLASAVKAKDGFFTTFFVSPYSRYLARWAARRGFTPNQITVTSMVLGILAALAFALGSRAGLVAGAVLLQIAFTTDCVDGQLARYTRQFSNLGAWLDSIFDRGKEYLVYAGLAIGATRMGFGDGIWLLAVAALALQTFRHVVDFSYAAEQHEAIAEVQHASLEAAEDGLSRYRRNHDVASTVDDGQEYNDDPDEEGPDKKPVRTILTGGAGTLGRFAIEASVFFERRPWMKWAKRVLVLPIGERFALISLTAALWGPRTTFTALLVWGTIAATYTTAGRVLRSIA
jgi:phosphatidylglycerophosphate synthase